MDTIARADTLQNANNCAMDRVLIPAVPAGVHRAALCCIAEIPVERPLPSRIAETVSSCLAPPWIDPIDPVPRGFGDMYASSCLAARVSGRRQAEPEVQGADVHTVLSSLGLRKQRNFLESRVSTTLQVRAEH